MVPWLRLCLPNAEGAGSIPGWETEIPRASRPENQNIRKKQYCNKFNKDFKNGSHQKNLKKKRKDGVPQGGVGSLEESDLRHHSAAHLQVNMLSTHMNNKSFFYLPSISASPCSTGLSSRQKKVIFLLFTLSLSPFEFFQ